MGHLRSSVESFGVEEGKREGNPVNVQGDSDAGQQNFNVESGVED